jgi:ankyrin repeat protein/outer membrane biosynthesis protein TonB
MKTKQSVFFQSLCRMVFFTSLPWVLAGAEPSILIYQTIQKDYPVHGFEGNRAFTLSEGNKQYLPLEGRFMLQADMDAMLQHGVFTPLFMRDNSNDPESDSKKFHVSLGNNGKGQTSWVNTFSSLFDRWSLQENEQTVFVVALMHPNETTHPARLYQYVPEPSDSPVNQAYKNTISLTSDADRIPVLLLINSQGQLKACLPGQLDPELLRCLLTDDAQSLGLLLQRNPKLIDRVYDSFGLLHLVSAWGSTQCLEHLLAAGANPNVRSSREQCPIHLAVAASRMDVVSTLIGAGAKVSLKDAEEDTPLHAAAYQGSHAMAQLLVEAGANTKGLNAKRLTAAMIAANEGHFELFRFLYESGSHVPLTKTNQQILLVRAIMEGNPDSVEFVLRTWPEGAKADFGLLPLHTAAKGGNPLIVQRLIDLGMDPNQSDTDGTTALMIASEHSLDCTRVLIEAGADVHLANANGATALHMAIFKQQFETSRFLLEHGADPNLKGPNGTPILWYAMIVGNRTGLNQLIEAGANCSMPQDAALRLMEYAFRYDIPEIVAITLNECLPPDFCFYKDIPGAWVARYYGSPEIETLLMQHGIPLETTDAPTLVSAGSVMDQIRPVHRPPVHYPNHLQDRFGAFTAKVQMIIDRDGQVVLPKITDNPVPELDRLILEIVDQWVFQPVIVDESPERVLCSIPIKFIPTPEELRVFEIEQTQIRPIPKRQVAPIYPGQLKRQKIEGRAIIVFIVDENGDVVAPKAEWASREEFIAPAIKSISQWKFSPGYVGGKPVRVRVRAPLVFQVM